jgi:hypothetical protein
MPLQVTRRQMLQGAAAALAFQALPASAQSALPSYTPPAPVQTTELPRGLASVTSVLHGVGVYVGNEWADWDNTARRFALARIRAWGFDFVCPKVGGYGRTCYETEAELRGWAEEARGIGLGFIPFLYTVPETGDADASLAAQMARVIGIVCVDMEDEWGAHEKGAVPGYKGAQMASFGAIYRREAGALPIVVTGYGDPVTRFGPADTGFPHAEMAAWADAYSPQWYIGVYSRYKKGGMGKGGVQAALDWGRAECRQAVGAEFPICPSVDLNCSFTPDHLLPLADTRLMMESLRSGPTPIFVWEYGEMTAPHAEALLGPPEIRNVRVGRTRQDSLSVVWDTSVPARSLFTCAAPVGTPQNSTGDTLELTQSAGASGLASGTAHLVTLQSSSGGGVSPSVLLTVATAPATPGVFVQSALAERAAFGHVVVTLFIANSASVPVPDVQMTALTVDGGAILSPAPLPQALGPLGKRDWQASTRDRVALEIIVASLPAAAHQATLHVSGTALGTPWQATLPVSIPA